MRLRKVAKAKSGAEKIPFIEGLRGLAALFVVLGHFRSMSDPRSFLGHTSFAPESLQRIMVPLAFGHLAVAAFIVISGFCLQMALFQKNDGRIRNLKKFFKRRAWRILPPYYACLAISVAVAIYITPLGGGAPFDLYLPVTTENVLAHVFMYHNFNPEWMYKINGVLWSIAIEAQLYLIFPLLLFLVLRVSRLLSLVLTAGLAVYVLQVAPVALKLYVWYLPLFVLGMVAANLAYRPNLRKGPRPGLAVVMAFLAVGACIFSCTVSTVTMPVRDTLIGIATAGVLYTGLVKPRHAFARVFGWKPLAILGGFSYSLYLMHHPIQQALYIYRPAWVIDETTTFVYLLSVGLPVILIGCWLFALLFERPFTFNRVRTEEKPRSEVHVPVNLPLAATAHQEAEEVPTASEPLYETRGVP